MICRAVFFLLLIVVAVVKCQQVVSSNNNNNGQQPRIVQSSSSSSSQHTIFSTTGDENSNSPSNFQYQQQQGEQLRLSPWMAQWLGQFPLPLPPQQQQTQSQPERKPTVVVQPQPQNYYAPVSLPMYVPRPSPPVPQPVQLPQKTAQQVISIQGGNPSSPSITCIDTKYLIPADQISYYECCGRNIYYWPSQKCELGNAAGASPSDNSFNQVQNQAPGTFSSSWSRNNNGTTITCNGVQYHLPATASTAYDCCRTQLYDRSVSQCNLASGVVEDLPAPNVRYPTVPVDQPVEILIGGDDIKKCGQDYVCCEGYERIWDPSGTMKCCPGFGPYDSTKYSCVPRNN